MQHKLDIVFARQNNPKYLYVIDASTYNSQINVQQPKLDILLPGRTTPVEFAFTPNTANQITSFTLGLTSYSFIDLPDGLWTIQYSVCPSDKLFKKFTFFRISSLYQKYYLALSKVKINFACNTDVIYTKSDEDLLRSIFILLNGIEANAESCNFETAKGMYKKAEFLIDTLINTQNCN